MPVYHAKPHFQFLCLIAIGLCSLLEPSLLFGDACNIKYKNKEFQVKTSGDGRAGELHLQLHFGKYKHLDVFMIENPYRLVVDAHGASTRIARNIKTGTCPIIKGIRFGNHPDKVRLVIDLGEENPPKFTWRESPGEILIILQDASSAAIGSDKLTEVTATPVTAIETHTLAPTSIPFTRTVPKVEILGLGRKPKEVPEKTPAIVPVTSTNTSKTLPTADATWTAFETLPPEAAPTPTASATPTLFPTLTLIPTHTASVAPTKTPSPFPTIEPTVAKPTVTKPTVTKPTALSQILPTDQALTDLVFAYNQRDRAPLIRLLFQRKPEFRLVKKDEKSYQISISDCSLKHDFLSLPQFPPHDFIGLTLVSPKTDRGGVEILVGVERGIRISALPKDNEIWVRLVNK